MRDAFSRKQLDGVVRPVRREDVGAAQRGRKRRRPRPAPSSRTRAPRRSSAATARASATPLGHSSAQYGEELLRVERIFVDELISTLQDAERQRPPGELDGFFYVISVHGSSVTDMRYRQLGSSDLQVSEISLGSWLTYGGGVEREQAEACVAKAFELGINFIDTANVYARGQAEEFLGEVLETVRATRTSSRRSCFSR